MKKPFKLLPIGLIVSIIFFVQCSKNDEVPKIINEEKISQNLKQYAEDFFKASLNIDEEFAKNVQIKRDPSFKKAVLLAKTERDLGIIMKNAGFINSETILTLIKKRLEIQNNFRASNQDFYHLEADKKNELLNKQYDLVLEKYIDQQNSFPKISSCANSFNTDISRCNRTYGKCAVIAILAAAEGLVPGLIVGVFCAWDLVDCKADAKEDYSDCVN